MLPWPVWISIGGVVVLAAYVFLWRPMRIAAREAQFAQQRKLFRIQRERLEAKFVQLASTRAKPGGAVWDDCDFDDKVAYVRDRHTGELAAFVAVTVPMPGYYNGAVGSDGLIGNLRAGTAVFRLDEDRWETDGRAILNLSPTEAIRLYRKDLEIVNLEPAQRS